MGGLPGVLMLMSERHLTTWAKMVDDDAGGGVCHGREGPGVEFGEVVMAEWIPEA